MYIGEYCTKLFGIALLKRKFVTAESNNRLKPKATVLCKPVKKYHLGMVDTCYHVKASYI